MKYLLLFSLLFLIGCKGCDIYSEPIPKQALRFFWDDSNNLPDSIGYYEVQGWGGEDTSGVIIFKPYNQVLSQINNISYVDSIYVENLWFQYRVRAIDKKGLTSDWAHTRFYKYTEFFLLSVENVRIEK